MRCISLSKSYNGIPIINDVSFEMGKGQIHVLMGPNGSGKSTFLRNLTLIELPDKGEIEINGNTYKFPQNQTSDIKIWPSVTMVFQHMFLWPHLTVKDNILIPLKKKFPLLHNAKLEETINFFELKSFIDRFPNEISGGQKQKVAVARAYALEPDYILLDEVTSSLDIPHTYNMINTIREISKKGTGVLLVTHSPEVAINCGEHFWIMENGTIREQGDKGIFSNPLSNFLKMIKEISRL